jgi:hypothetical protein|tara:strand:- start:2370 stop:2600 length:231 start_codon:yes stop_codon:yes gene_type:complete
VNLALADTALNTKKPAIPWSNLYLCPPHWSVMISSVYSVMKMEVSKTGFYGLMPCFDRNVCLSAQNAGTKILITTD